MANYMKQVAEILGVELDKNFVVIHGEDRSTVKITEDGLVFVFHLGSLKEDAKSICLYNILNGDFEIEHIDEKETTKEDKQNGVWIRNSYWIRL